MVVGNMGVMVGEDVGGEMMAAYMVKKANSDA